MPKRTQQRKQEPALRVARTYSEVAHQYRMQGEKISITELIRRAKPVLANSYVMRPSKFSNSEYMSIQMEIEGKPYYTETASASVIDKILRVKNELPVYVTFKSRVGKVGRAYETVE